MKPLALVSTVVPPIVVVFRRRARGRRCRRSLAPATASPNSTSAATARPAAVIPAARAIAGGIWAGNRGRGRCRAARRGLRRGGSKRERGQDHESGHLHQAGGDAGAGADLLEPEQPDPDRQEVAAEGSEGEAGSGRGRQPAGDDEPAGDGQHRQPEAEGRDHLQQEQPPDRRDRPVPGQVQVEMDRCGGDQQTRTRHAQDDCGPAGRRPFGVLLRGPPRAPYRSQPGHAVPLCHLSVLRVRPGAVRSVPVASAAGAR